MSDTATIAGHAQPRRPDSSIVETIQSLVVAFVLAMTFRGYVTEGFVIPTGSMAPTLLGKHVRLHASATGYEYAMGYDAGTANAKYAYKSAADPMLGPSHPGSGVALGDIAPRPRMGDRILVLKSLYPFSSPSRFDVVVFKNPRNPNGEDGNYIKRLVGLPGDSIWFVDGDVFVGDAATADDLEAYHIARKPEHVQRAVWQPVHDSRFIPRTAQAAEEYYRGAPWQGGTHWVTDNERAYHCDSAEPTTLAWESHFLELTDWAPYNMLGPTNTQPRSNVSDLRVRATIVPEQDGLVTALEIVAREMLLQFRIDGTTAQVRMRPEAYGAGDEHPDEGWIDAMAPVTIDALEPGKATNVEFWHVDQALSIYLDGRRVAYEEYDWTPRERLARAAGESDVANADVRELAARPRATAPRVSWRFRGSPVTLRRVRVDRDIFYRDDRLNGRNTLGNPTNPGVDPDIVRHGQYAFGTHPDNLAVLGPDHFLMCGDNSRASLDSRLWGNPHPMVAAQIDPAPFVVHRKLLLGKAWVVYFPAPLPMGESGKSIIPDFGRLRFVR